MLGYTPHDQTPLPPDQTPWDQNPPGADPVDQTPLPGSRLQHTVNERPVRILLECILASNIFCDSFKHTLDMMHIFTVRKRICGKVMFLHLSVSHSVHGGVCLSACCDTPPGQTPLGRHPQCHTPPTQYMLRYTHSCPVHAWIDMAAAADGTHPGMHSFID